MPHEKMRLHLSACPPFSLGAVITSHGWAQLPPFAADVRLGTLTRVERLEGGRVIDLHICETTDGVSVSIYQSLSGPEREEISRKVWWMLSLGEDIRPFHHRVRGEARLAHVEQQCLGRLLRSPTVFEDVVKTILTTNTSWAGTVRMTGALVSHLGAPLPTDPSRNAFPTPAQIAAMSEHALRQIGLGYRAPYVAELARQVDAGEIDLQSLTSNNQTTDEIRQCLCQIRGVGDYAAATLLMLLGCYDHIPVDSWARKLVSREWHGGQPVGPQEVERAFERWGAWKGLAYWFWNWSE